MPHFEEALKGERAIRQMESPRWCQHGPACYEFGQGQTCDTRPYQQQEPKLAFQPDAFKMGADVIVNNYGPNDCVLVQPDPNSHLGAVEDE
jgi:hypothetical protein